ncbi:hypothetical protein GCM10028825_44350 [Spirosoma agri]
MDIAVENVPSNVGVRIVVYNAATQGIADDYNYQGKNMYLSSLVCDAGTYYVLIRNAYSDENSAL